MLTSVTILLQALSQEETVLTSSFIRLQCLPSSTPNPGLSFYAPYDPSSPLNPMHDLEMSALRCIAELLLLNLIEANLGMLLSVEIVLAT